MFLPLFNHGQRGAIRNVFALTSTLEQRGMKVVFAETNGEHLVVFLTESDRDDNDWNIVAARPMWPDEVAMFDKLVAGGSHEAG